MGFDCKLLHGEEFLSALPTIEVLCEEWHHRIK
jgi:hypothetical protein